MKPYMDALFSLSGKTAIVTGATGGIGSEMCLALAEAGANIMALRLENDNGITDLKKEVERNGARFQSEVCDLADSQALRRTFQKLWDMGIEPDILLNCAGLNRRAPITQMTDDQVDLVSRYTINNRGQGGILTIGFLYRYSRSIKRHAM
jgi:2-deoxy-D-gluconate 3-dehydrogenase